MPAGSFRTWSRGFFFFPSGDVKQHLRGLTTPLPSPRTNTKQLPPGTKEVWPTAEGVASEPSRRRANEARLKEGRKRKGGGGCLALEPLRSGGPALRGIARLSAREERRPRLSKPSPALEERLERGRGRASSCCR